MYQCHYVLHVATKLIFTFPIAPFTGIIALCFINVTVTFRNLSTAIMFPSSPGNTDELLDYACNRKTGTHSQTNRVIIILCSMPIGSVPSAHDLPPPWVTQCSARTIAELTEVYSIEQWVDEGMQVHEITALVLSESLCRAQCSPFSHYLWKHLNFPALSVTTLRVSAGFISLSAWTSRRNTASFEVFIFLVLFVGRFIAALEETHATTRHLPQPHAESGE